MGKNAWPLAMGLGLWAVACGGASANDFDAPPAAGQGGSSGASTGKGGSGGKGGTTGGSVGQSGSGTGGTSGSGTGGASTGGAGGGSSATGGMGAAGGTESGGTSGDAGTGGTAGTETGGSAGMETGGSAGMETGGSAGTENGGSAGVGGGLAGRAGSGGMPNCSLLTEQYAKALEEAQVCSPEIDRPQCTVQVQSSLLCGCPTWANVDNQEAITALQKLVQQAASCIVPCPAILCVAPGTGICTSSEGSGGHCVNSGLEI